MCIVEARTVYPALLVVVIAFRRPGWTTVAACGVAALVLLVLDVDPDVEGLRRPAALGMAIVAAGTWSRLPAPVPR